MPSSDGCPDNKIATDYLMMPYAPLDRPQWIDSSLIIYNVRPATDWARPWHAAALRFLQGP